MRTNPKTSRSIALYGYVRGIHLRNLSAIHVPGVGDMRIKSISALADPCPLPTNQKAKRNLNEREQVVYAPLSGLGGLLYDKDAVYIDTGGSHSFGNKVGFLTALRLSFNFQLPQIYFLANS
jgi:ribosome biogenesis protein BMS1